jgi:hypothetical protein
MQTRITRIDTNEAEEKEKLGNRAEGRKGNEAVADAPCQKLYQNFTVSYLFHTVGARLEGTIAGSGIRSAPKGTKRH